MAKHIKVAQIFLVSGLAAEEVVDLCHVCYSETGVLVYLRIPQIFRHVAGEHAYNSGEWMWIRGKHIGEKDKLSSHRRPEGTGKDRFHLHLDFVVFTVSLCEFCL